MFKLTLLPARHNLDGSYGHRSVCQNNYDLDIEDAVRWWIFWCICSYLHLSSPLGVMEFLRKEKETVEGLLPALWQTAASGPDAIFSEIIIHFLFLKKLKCKTWSLLHHLTRLQGAVGDGGGGGRGRGARGASCGRSGCWWCPCSAPSWRRTARKRGPTPRSTQASPAAGSQPQLRCIVVVW